MTGKHKWGETALRVAGEREVLGQYQEDPTESISIRSWIIANHSDVIEPLDGVPASVLLDLYSDELAALAEKTASSFLLWEGKKPNRPWGTPESMEVEDWLTAVGTAAYGLTRGTKPLTREEILLFNQFSWKVRDATRTDSAAFALNQAINAQVREMTGWTEVLAGLWVACWLVVGNDFLDNGAREIKLKLTPYADKYLKMLAVPPDIAHKSRNIF